MFSSITQPNYPKAALGLEKGSISVVMLDKAGRGQYSVRQAATAVLPAGLLTPGFLDANIAEPREFAACLQEAVEDAGLMNQKRWSVALPSSTARTSIFVLESEPVSKKETDEILDWKAGQSFGAPAAELRIAKQKIAPDKDGKTRYFVTAVTLAVLDEYETQFESLGWKAGLILPRSIAESKWLTGGTEKADSLLISSTDDGFTALLLRGSEPTVVRSVTCTPEEIDDEIYRLLMFYNDRFSSDQGFGMLEKLLVIGKGFVREKITQISTEALGRALRTLTPTEIGLYFPDTTLDFDEIAAPAGLAALGFA